MIPDLFIGLFFRIFEASINGLPDMGPVPWQMDDLLAFRQFVGTADFLLPISDIMEVLPEIFTAFGLLVLLKYRRIIR